MTAFAPATFIGDTLHLLLRHLRTTLRIPIWIVVTLVQPVIWLTLYGQLFRSVAQLPGFEGVSYIQFLTPGIVIMTALFGSMWEGMGLIQDHTEGVLDRMLATPVYRGAIIAARVLHAAVTVGAQSIIILLFGLVLGAEIVGGFMGAVAILLISALLGAGFSALSSGIALLTKREESLIAVVNFIGLPLTFLSSAFMTGGLMPDWIRAIARWNPVEWGVEGARHAMFSATSADVWLNAGHVALFTVAMTVFATLTFRVYRRTA